MPRCMICGEDAVGGREGMALCQEHFDADPGIQEVCFDITIKCQLRGTFSQVMKFMNIIESKVVDVHYFYAKRNLRLRKNNPDPG